MARFSGKQFKGAKRVAKDMRRNEAEVRNQKFQEQKTLKMQKAFDELRELEDKLGFNDVEEGFVS